VYIYALHAHVIVMAHGCNVFPRILGKHCLHQVCGAINAPKNYAVCMFPNL
jgi:hypothetical protein